MRFVISDTENPRLHFHTQWNGHKNREDAQNPSFSSREGDFARTNWMGESQYGQLTWVGFSYTGVPLSVV